MNKIVFFNHYHRGDLHTSKEFVRQVVNELKDFEFGYLHNNPSKLLSDLNIKTLGNPMHLERANAVYKDGDTLYINTWVGSQWDVFCKNGGINMLTLYEQWGKLFNAINKLTGSSLKLKDKKEDYLPTINKDVLFLDGINEYLKVTKKRVLICNNVPNSNQSFQSDMEEFIIPLAESNPDIDFICTDEIYTDLPNVLYTNQIIRCSDGVDLQEISYLSKFCDVIVGKNSGPFVFCETYDNYMDESKKFVSFNAKHKDYDDIKETMSNGLDIKCSYKTVPILDIISLTSDDRENIKNALSEALELHEET